MILRLRSDEFPYDQQGVDVQTRLEAIRYNWSGSHRRSYYFGDTRSWQRYTRDLPCAVDFTVDATARTIQAALHEPLIPCAWYALVFLHGNHCSQPTGGRANIYDDYVIPFQTRAAPVLQLSEHRINHERLRIHVASMAGEKFL